MKHWLQTKFLPMWAKESVLRDNRLLKAENQKLQYRLNELEAYVLGIRLGLRAVRSGNRGGEK